MNRLRHRYNLVFIYICLSFAPIVLQGISVTPGFLKSTEITSDQPNNLTDEINSFDIPFNDTTSVAKGTTSSGGFSQTQAVVNYEFYEADSLYVFEIESLNRIQAYTQSSSKYVQASGTGQVFFTIDAPHSYVISGSASVQVSNHLGSGGILEYSVALFEYDSPGGSVIGGVFSESDKSNSISSSDSFSLNGSGEGNLGSSSGTIVGTLNPGTYAIEYTSLLDSNNGTFDEYKMGFNTSLSLTVIPEPSGMKFILFLSLFAFLYRFHRRF